MAKRVLISLTVIQAASTGFGLVVPTSLRPPFSYLGTIFELFMKLLMLTEFYSFYLGDRTVNSLYDVQ